MTEDTRTLEYELVDPDIPNVHDRTTGPEDLYYYAFWAYRHTENGPQLIWDFQGAIPPLYYLELAEHIEAYADHLREQYWKFMNQGERHTPLPPGEDRAYE